MRSDPLSAWTASGRRSPWVSEITPIMPLPFVQPGLPVKDDGDGGGRFGPVENQELLAVAADIVHTKGTRGRQGEREKRLGTRWAEESGTRFDAGHHQAAARLEEEFLAIPAPAGMRSTTSGNGPLALRSRPATYEFGSRAHVCFRISGFVG